MTSESLRASLDAGAKLAFGYSCAFMIGLRTGGGTLNAATCVPVSRGKTHFLVIAEHVLAGFENRASSEDVVAYLSDIQPPVPFDPRTRIVYRDQSTDIAVLRVESPEIIGSTKYLYDRLPHTPQSPPPPLAGEFVLIAGFPKVMRTQVANHSVSFDAFVTGGRLTTVLHDRLNITLERDYWLSNSSSTIPPPRDLEGLSGGPVFRTSGLAFDLIGVVSQHDPSLDHLVCARLDNIPPSAWNAA